MPDISMQEALNEAKKFSRFAKTFEKLDEVLEAAAQAGRVEQETLQRIVGLKLAEDQSAERLLRAQSSIEEAVAKATAIKADAEKKANVITEEAEAKARAAAAQAREESARVAAEADAKVRAAAAQAGEAEARAAAAEARAKAADDALAKARAAIARLKEV